MSEQMKMDAERVAFNAYLNEIVETKQVGALTIKLQRHDEYTVDDEKIAWNAWQARASLPVGVPDGWRLVPVEPTQDMWAAYRNADDRGIFFHQAYRAMLAATPTVKAEQVQAGADWVMRLLDTGEWRLTRFRNDPSMTEDYCRRNSWQVERQRAPYCGDNEVTFWRAETAEQAFTAAINDLFPGRAEEFGRPAPSLPAAGSAVEEVEVVAYLFIKPDGKLSMDAVRHKPSQAAEPVMTVAQHERIVAALSAQQSAPVAPERVSVPVNLALKLVRTYEDAIVDAAHWTDMGDEVTQLRALLASHAEGGKV